MTTLVKQIRQVVGVKNVKIVNFREGHFSVFPEPGKTVAPRLLWDAIVKAGFTPDKLQVGGHEYRKRP